MPDKILINSASYYPIDKNNGHCFVRLSYEEAKNILFIPKTNTEAMGNLTELFTNMIDYDEGYQRLGNLGRMKRFANYLLENKNIYVPPIILSARGKWEFIPEGNDQNTGNIEINGKAAVIDGQHRLGGFLIYCSENNIFDLKINCEVILNIDNEKEMELFKTINKEQKGVDVSHLTNLIATYQGEENVPEATAIILSDSENSPLKGLIRKEIGIKGKNFFTLATVAKEIKYFSTSAPEFKSTNSKTLSEILINYWDIIKKLHPDEWEDIYKKRQEREYKLLETTGFIALSKFAAPILQRAIIAGTIDNVDGYSTFEMNWDFVKKILSNTTNKIDWSKVGTYENATGNRGATLIYKDLEDNFINFQSTEEYKQLQT